MFDNLFKEADRLDRERTATLWNDDPEWTGKREALYANGPIYGMYRERNETLLVALDNLVDIQKLKLLFEKNIVNNHEHLKCFKKKVYEYNGFSKEAQRKCDEEIQNRHYAIIEQLRKINSPKEFLAFINSYNPGLLEDLMDESLERQLTFLQIYYEYDEYKRYRARVELFSDSIPELDTLYDCVFDKKSEYKKYDLIPIDEHRTLKVMNPTRIYDNQIDKTIMLGCPKRLAEILCELLEKKLIGKMAFKGTSEIYDGKYVFQYFYEEVERGRIFSYNLNSFDDVTKLYSQKYDDQLWIIKENKDIYFEELDEKFADFEESVITKMLHVEMKNDKFIKHMDFEYIFYTIDEFDKRKQFANTEGTGKKRRKLFKIDDCKIPFDYKIEMIKFNDDKIKVPFLYFVLSIYFEHKDILNEYFAEVCR